MNLKRRSFLKVSSLVGGGLLISFQISGSEPNSDSKTVKLNNFLSIDSNGQIIFNLTKHEMGQGSGTGLPMILADELCADWSKISVVRSDYDPTFSWREMGTTGGSSTIYKMWHILREAGATARMILMQAAANHWGLEVSTLKAKNNFVINPSTGEKLAYGELSTPASKLPIPTKIQLKEIKEFVYINKPVKNLITEKVVVGTGNYGINMNLPGMVHASIEKCPVYKGKLKSFDPTGALKVFGVIDVIPIRDLIPSSPDQHIQEGVAVIAKSTWSAFQGRKALEIEWDLGKNKSQSIKNLERLIDGQEEKELITEYNKGDLKSLETDKSIDWISCEYTNPYQAHALMEPINATAYCMDYSCEVWVGTQSGERMIREVKKITNLPDDKIKVHVLNSGGSFGRRWYADSTMEAVYISRQIGKPVKVTWTREDEISHDYFHPFQRSVHRAGIKNGKIVGWDALFLRTTRYAFGDEIDEIHYDFPNIYARSEYVPSILHTGAWRSVAEHSSSLGRESFIDELAVKTNKNPIDFRLELLSKEIKLEGTSDRDHRIYEHRKLVRRKYKQVLEKLKEDAWFSREKRTDIGRGMAIDTFGSVVAHAVEVSLDSEKRNGFRVEKVRSIVHCGTIVNPHFALGQIEGSIIWALTAVLYGGVEVENGKVQRSNFHDNPILRIDEVPEIEVTFIPSTESPTGLGEPATPPLAPAILNALYDLTKKRLRKIPVLKSDLTDESDLTDW